MIMARSPFVLLFLLAGVTTGMAGESTFNFWCLTNGQMPSKYSSSGLDVIGPLVSTSKQDFKCSYPLEFGVTPSGASSNVRPMIESELDITKFKTGAKAISIETWFTPTKADTMPNGVRAPIVTIGQRELMPAANDCGGYNFRLAQVDSSGLYEMAFTDDSFYSENSCRRIRIRFPQTKNRNSLTQLVFVLDNDDVRAYLDGTPLPDSFTGKLKRWNDNYGLQLFSNHVPDDSTVFSGSIHRLVVMDFAMNEQAVADSYSKGREYITSAKYAPPTNAPTVAPTSLAPTWAPSTLVTEPFRKISLLQEQAEGAVFTVAGNVSLADLPATWVMELEIMTLPQHGRLSNNDTAKILKVGDRLTCTVDSEDSNIIVAPSIRYSLPSTTYFNTPEFAANGTQLDIDPESFRVRFMLSDSSSDDNQVIATSSAGEFNVEVVHVNHQPTLMVLGEGFVMKHGEDDHMLYAELAGTVEVDDPQDRDIDKIRVDVSAKSGKLTLKEESRHLADFGEACSKRDGNGRDNGWQCEGDGVEDRRMIFLASPSDVKYILANLEYEGWTKQDTVTLKVFDGVGEGCPSESEHLEWAQALSTTHATVSPTRHNGCFQAVAAIEVSFPEESNDEKGQHQVLVFGTEYWEDGLNHAKWSFMLVALGGLLCCGGCCFFMCKRAMFNRSKINVDHDAPNQVSAEITDEESEGEKSSSEDDDGLEDVDLEDVSVEHDAADIV